MCATAVVGGRVVRFKLSPALARSHGQDRGKANTEAEAVALAEASRRARARNELARAGLIEAWVSPAILEEYANVLGEHRNTSPKCRALPQMLSGDHVQFH